MPTAREILSSLPIDRFAEILSASPKNFREELFRRAGVRVKTDAFSVGGSSKNRVRAEKLHQALEDSAIDLQGEVWDEVIRNYLYTRRELLGDALDQLEVPHVDGLTDEDLGFLDKLDPARGKKLREFLRARHAEGDVDLYMSFMNIPEAKEA